MNRNIFFPELNNSIYKYFRTSVDITTEFLYFPENISEDFVKEDSIFHLLFNENFSHNGYNYLFKTIDISLFPYNVINRIKNTNQHIDCYISDNSGYNILNLNNEELFMLNKLFFFRKDFIVDIAGIEFSDITSLLSKSIYSYLSIYNEKIIEILDDFIDLDISGQENILYKLFYAYVLDKIHFYIRNSSFIIDSTATDSYFFKVKILPAEDSTSIPTMFEFDGYPKPISLEEVFLYKNGDIIDKKEFFVDFQDGKLIVSLDFEVKSRDVIILEYLTIDRNIMISNGKIDNLYYSCYSLYWRY